MSRLSLPLRGLFIVSACSTALLPRAALAEAFAPVASKGHFAHPIRVLARLRSGPHPAAARAADSGGAVRAWDITDAAFAVSLNPGIHTVHARGKDDTEGVALVELYVVP